MIQEGLVKRWSLSGKKPGAWSPRIKRRLRYSKDFFCRSANVNLMKFNKAKCKGLHLGRDTPKHKHRWVENGWRVWSGGLRGGD